MWVERIEIGGFGRIRDLTVELHEGLNVVSGLNEAGKSTLHQAIATGLFGCYSSTDHRREADAVRRRDRFAPWDGGAKSAPGRPSTRVASPFASTGTSAAARPSTRPTH